MSERKRKSFLSILLHAPVHLYHWNLGWILGRRFLLLTHIGRRTSTRYQTVLEIIEYRPTGPEFVVMSGFGPNAQWLRNIEVAPAFVEVGTRKFAATHRILPENEAVEVIRGYERRNRLLIPVVRAVLSRLLGWKYSGSDSDRHRLVAQLPVLAFRPK